MQFIRIHRNRLFVLNCPDGYGQTAFISVASASLRCPVGRSADSRGDTLGTGDRTCSQIAALRLLIAVAKLRRQQKCRIMEAWTDRLIQGIKGNEPTLHRSYPRHSPHCPRPEGRHEGSISVTSIGVCDGWPG